MTTADHLQLWMAVICLPITALFIYMFGKPSERWWRSWFGISLMLLAIAIFWAELSVVLFRFWGMEYYGRDIIRVGAQFLTLTAMGLRTWVLFVAQRHDKIRHPRRMR